jgi:hypothetical protein
LKFVHTVHVRLQGSVPVVVNPAKDSYGFAITLEAAFADLTLVAMIEECCAISLKLKMNCPGSSIDLNEHVRETRLDSDDFLDPNPLMAARDHGYEFLFTLGVAPKERNLLGVKPVVRFMSDSRSCLTIKNLGWRVAFIYGHVFLVS